MIENTAVAGAFAPQIDIIIMGVWDRAQRAGFSGSWPAIISVFLE